MHMVEHAGHAFRLVAPAALLAGSSLRRGEIPASDASKYKHPTQQQQKEEEGAKYLSSPHTHITRPNHHTDRPAASNASTAPSSASKAEISVSLFSTVSRELRVS